MSKVGERSVTPRITSTAEIAAGAVIDELRLIVSRNLDAKRKIELGQFMTPWSIARFMASMFRKWPAEVSLLDPGAGVGSLTEAFAESFFERAYSGSQLTVTGYEIDPVMLRYLQQRATQIEVAGKIRGRKVAVEVVERDFLREGAFSASFGGAGYSHVILNPPYKKIGANSEYRLLLREYGIETVNLYTAFLGLAVALTKEGGEVVAIVPRSFCNGRYFRPFRHWLLQHGAIHNIHVFESRRKAFSDDDVLQENVIIRFERGAAQGVVTISTSHDASFADYSERAVPFDNVVKPNDPEKFIHIPTLELNGNGYLFSHSLTELGLDVATGPVVDFRVREHWLDRPVRNSAPLLYTHHFRKSVFRWPQNHKKPNALRINAETMKWLLPRGWYTITKRFSSKEERRRIVAYVVDPGSLDFDYYGFENHLNVIHAGKEGLPAVVARGLAVFLNSTVVDQHFRAFSGHTQVNATDLRSMRFPSKKTLAAFGKWAAKHRDANQVEIDSFVERHG